MTGPARRMLQRWPFLQTLPTVGITLSDLLVAVSVRGGPLRVTGVYRCRLDAVLGNTDLAARTAATEARRALRVPVGTPAVLAVDPVERTVDLPLRDGWGCEPLAVHVDGRCIEALEQAGFSVERLDARPAALARLAHRSPSHRGHLIADSWQVALVENTLTAWRTEPIGVTAGRPDAPTHRRPTDQSKSARLELQGVRIPETVGRHLSLERDGAALGAALRAFGFAPDLMVEPIGGATAATSPAGER